MIDRATPQAGSVPADMPAGALAGHFDAYQQAKAAVEADLERLAGADCDARWVELDAQMQRAMDRLFLTPAPDLPSLSYKLTVMHDVRITDGWWIGPQAVAAVAEDARRLAQGAAANPLAA